MITEKLIYINITNENNIILIFNQRVKYVVVMTNDFINYIIIYLL